MQIKRTGAQAPEAYTLAEVSAMYQVGRTKLHEETTSGRLKVFRIGRAVRVHREDLERWLALYRGESEAA